MDDMEVDPGINSPSPGSRSPVKIEMKISETHSVKFKKSQVCSPTKGVAPGYDCVSADGYNYEGESSTQFVKLRDIRV